LALAHRTKAALLASICSRKVISTRDDEGGPAVPDTALFDVRWIHGGFKQGNCNKGTRKLQQRKNKWAIAAQNARCHLHGSLGYE
jgi:hypothetical protein